MNTVSAHDRRRPFAKVIDTVAAFVAECNYASARLVSLQSPLLSGPAAEPGSRRAR